jgi:hypothetical protein
MTDRSIQWGHDILTGKAKPDCSVIDTGVTIVAKDNFDSSTH